MASVRKRPGKIPMFASIEEEAAFWDRHSTTDFEDEWEPVAVATAPNLVSQYIVQIELDADTFHRLRQIAHQRGLHLSELTQSWVEQELGRAHLNAGTESPRIKRRTPSPSEEKHSL